MNSKFPTVEVSRDDAPAQDTDVEYALILSQMIEVAESDHSQLRLAIYEFARTKLINNTLNETASERERLSHSLETAIAGVERFSRMRDNGHQRVVFRHGGAEVSDRAAPVAAQLALAQAAPDHLRSEFQPAHPPIGPAPASVGPIRMHRPTSGRGFELPWIARELVASRQRRTWVFIGLFVLALATIALTIPPRFYPREDKKIQTAAPSELRKNENAAAVAQPQEPSIPLPADYGIYLLDGPSLRELEPLETLVPDKRIQMSTPISQVHQVSITDGLPKFLIYRRDLSNNPPDKIEIRPVARVRRTISFDPKGKPVFSSASSSWTIRNLPFEYRVRPVPGRPEMLLLQAKEGAAELPSGRYVLVLKDRGYDFVVAGEVTDPSQCVERTEAANGSFYSDCK